ncbi:MAG: hypothetical protein JOY59_05410, partial [Candidatus Eremiobacteraeota bacterium]|nr:hypothetical protein [Candidatus Eremiobacteraeota bacterium]
IDCARSEKGDILVFEADAAMLVHCRDRPDIFPYKYTYVPPIFAALEELMRVRIDHVA